MDRERFHWVHWPRLFVPVLIMVWFLVPILDGEERVLASLSIQDAAALENCLNKIALGTASPDDYTTCNTLLAQPQPSADWTNFFRDYFSDHPFPQKLWDYLTGPVFWGQGNEAVLQTGLIPVFEELITRIVSAHPADLGPSLAASVDTRDTLLNANRMFANIAHVGKVSDSERQGIFVFYTNLVKAFPQYWRKTAVIDPTVQPYVGALAAQIHSNLRDMLPLNAANKSAIAQALDLQGRYLDIWQEFSVLLYDNNGFDAAQREYIYRFLSLNPKELVVVAGISQMELLGNGGNTHLPILLGGVNVFSNRVGEIAENPFPSDGANYSCDLFGTVVAHEDYHAVFANYVGKQPALLTRHNQLIEQAGRDPANYLRGGSPGFFYENPQEFLASLANQWFCSSADMVRLGISRFLRGNPHGINQALFFSDLESVGSGYTWLYTNDTQGSLNRRPAAVTRNAAGYINSIVLPEATYRFEIDQAGMVTRLWLDGAGLAVEPNGGIKRFYKPGESGDVQFILHNTGKVPLQLWVEPLAEGAANRGALQLEGRSAVQVFDSPTLNLTAQVTLEAWVYPLTWVNPPFSNGRILQKGYGDDQYRLLKEGSAFVFDVANVGALRVETAIPPINRWTHVAGTYDGKALRLYVNGVQVSQMSASGSMGLTSDPLIIGNKDIGGSDGLVGYLDDVRVWSVARTPAQIRDGMSGSVSGQSGLRGEWRFDTPGGGSVEDSSPNHNPGSLNGAARISAPDGPNGLIGRLDWWSGELSPGQSQVVTVHIETGDSAEGIYPIYYQIRSSGSSEPVRYPLTLQVSSDPPEFWWAYLPLIFR